MDVLRAALGEDDADLPRRVLRHQARRDLRRALPRPRRAPRPRRCRRRLARQPAARRSSRRPASRPRCAPTSQNCIDTAELLPRRHRRRGAGHHRRPARRDRADAAARPAATASCTIGNAFYGIVTPLYNRDYWFLLSTALRPALDGRRHGADAAGRPLLLARARRLHRQLHRGDLRDQLPRRPVVGPASTRCAAEFAGLRGGVADLRPDLRLVADRLPRVHGAGRPRSRSTSAPRAPPRSWWSAPPATRPRR